MWHYVVTDSNCIPQMYVHKHTYLGNVWFMPPQVYELSRLMGIKAYQSLLEFAIKRSGLGTTMFLPIGYNCQGSMVFVLPGMLKEYSV